MAWLNDFRKEASFDLSAVCGRSGWKTLFRGCLPDGQLDPVFHVSPAQMFLLWGDPGSGRATLCEGLAGELAGYGYGFIHIPAVFLAGENEKEAWENVYALGEELAAAFEDGKKICLFLEELEDLSERRSACRLLSRGFTDIEEKERPFILTATADRPEKIPGALRKNMLAGRVGPPGIQSRKVFLKTLLSACLGPESPALEYMAGQTEGMDYGALVKLVAAMRMAWKQEALIRYGFDAERVCQAVLRGEAPISENMARKIVARFRMAAAVDERKTARQSGMTGEDRENGPAPESSQKMAAMGGKDGIKEEKSLIDIIEHLDDLRDIQV